MGLVAGRLFVDRVSSSRPRTIMSHFTETDLKKIYDANDVDGDKMLDLTETKKAYAQLGEHAKKVDNFEAEFNKLAKDGNISFSDFKHFAILH